MVWILSNIIKFYQKHIRVFFPNTCRFYPSCSEYALESLKKNGCIKGSIKAILRILKCSPFSKGGYDPVR